MDSPLTTSKRRLIQLKPMTPETPSRGLNIDRSITQNELQRLLGQSSYLNSTGFDNISFGTASILGALDSEQEEQAVIFKEKLETLFPQFLEVLQSRTNESDVFDTIQDLIQICAVVLEDLQKELERSGTMNAQRATQAAWLEQELKTWKLIYALYRDRVRVQADSSGSMDCEMPPLGASEKEVVEHLFATNPTLREFQLIVDWLEATYEDQNGLDVGHSNDRMMGWENTLFQLQNRNVAFGHGAEIVKSLDPDAPIREQRPLHALDEEDNLRLLRSVFKEIRQGHIEQAMSLCKHCGQTWRAALLEGWRLHEDPNHFIQHSVNEKLPIEGNPRRDLWKKCAWMIADSKKYDEYWRAIIGTFCGHLESLKSLLGNSWEDLLWSYLKVQIDVKVETEIRTSSCLKTYMNMPEAYWNSKMSLDQIFDELTVHNDAAVREYAESKIGIIQKHLMLDNVTDLLQEIQNWVENQREQSLEPNENSTRETLSPHLLRFLTHIVLFMRQIGRIEKEEVADVILGAYVETLIKLGDAQLVSFYTATLPNQQQIELYSKFLGNIYETPERTFALKAALNAHLDVEHITRYTVETMRKRLPYEANTESIAKPRAGDITLFDERKIQALEWLTFLPTQRGDLIWQANCMIRNFLAESKTECVRATYKMVPIDALAQIRETYGSEDNFPIREQCVIKELFCYQVYLAALDYYSSWNELFHNRPKAPELVGADANFTERVASEHKAQVHQTELERWRNSLEESSQLTRDALYNVLLFPNGWLMDPQGLNNPKNISENDWENRRIQMEKLRSICIPEIVLLLYQLLQQSDNHQDCVRLSEILADEDRKLYKVYTKHKLAEILFKLSESSLELLNSKVDPWGFPATL